LGENIPAGEFEFIFGNRRALGSESSESICPGRRIEVSDEVGSKAG